MEQCKCPICFGTHDTLCSLECEHMICFKCLADWYDYTTTLTCPLCRSSSHFFDKIENMVEMILLRVKELTAIKKIPLSILISFIDFYIVGNKYKQIWDRSDMKRFRKHLKDLCLDCFEVLEIINMSHDDFLIYNKLTEF